MLHENSFNCLIGSTENSWFQLSFSMKDDGNQYFYLWRMKNIYNAYRLSKQAFLDLLLKKISNWIQVLELLLSWFDIECHYTVLFSIFFPLKATNLRKKLYQFNNDVKMVQTSKRPLEIFY